MRYQPRIAVIGLGYVGLPLAVALSRHFPVLGYDIKQSRVEGIRAGHDLTGEVDASVLRASTLELSSDSASLRQRDVYIITVPTPVDPTNRPDLGSVIAACRMVGKHMSVGAIVVLESTVYPGVTEKICGAEIAKASLLEPGRDFFLGYSPERVNPGDRLHTIDRITKVVAGQTPEVADRLRQIYGAVTGGNIFTARDIKTAEAAKVIENAQRDINIAFINEVTMIFNKLGMSIYDVLDASRTKWNFLPFVPGLVGGHCIGVDPFYLADLATKIGHEPTVILAGRKINDGMGFYIAGKVAEALDAVGKRAGARILVLGLAFKEDVPDLRNSRVMDVIQDLRRRGYKVDIHDPIVDPDEARIEYEVDLLSSLDSASDYDAVVVAVAHKWYCEMSPNAISALLAADGLIADVKGVWRGLAFPPTFHRWQL